MGSHSLKILELAAKQLEVIKSNEETRYSSGGKVSTSHSPFYNLPDVADQRDTSDTEFFKTPDNAYNSDGPFSTDSGEECSDEDSSDSDEFIGSRYDTDDINTDAASGTATPSSSITSDAAWNDITTSSIDFDLYTEECTLDPKVSSTVIRKPIDIFNLLVNDEVLDLIVKETNDYAAQQLNKRHSNKSRVTSWTNTNKTEIRRFLGITLAMRLTQVPSVNLYWSKDPLYHNELIASILPRDRYILLLKCLHFSNNETEDVNNRLHEIKTVLSLLLKNYKIFNPGRVLVIDESMVPFRGRLHFRQYIPNKTHRYVKLYKLCTSRGYTYNIKVYAGKGDTNTNVEHLHSIVLKLLEAVDPKEGRYVFADNFYSSIKLAEALYDQKILYCGTMRLNQIGVPKGFTVKLRKNEVLGKEKNKVKIIKWMDKRQVLMVTSDPSHNDTLISTGKKSRKGEEILKPKCIIDYNKVKNGVDFSDQMSSYHTVLCKSLKWYRKVMFEILLGTTVVNSWIIYNMVADTKLGITEFRRRLVNELVIEQDAEKETPSTRKRLHTFVKPEGPGRKKRKPCRGCYNTLREKMTSREADKNVRRIISYCNDCPGHPGYCLPCFNISHT